MSQNVISIVYEAEEEVIHTGMMKMKRKKMPLNILSARLAGIGLCL